MVIGHTSFSSQRTDIHKNNYAVDDTMNANRAVERPRNAARKPVAHRGQVKPVMPAGHRRGPVQPPVNGALRRVPAPKPPVNAVPRRMPAPRPGAGGLRPRVPQPRIPSFVPILHAPTYQSIHRLQDYAEDNYVDLPEVVEQYPEHGYPQYHEDLAGVFHDFQPFQKYA